MTWEAFGKYFQLTYNIIQCITYCIEYFAVYIKDLKYLGVKKRISADTSRKIVVMGAVPAAVQTPRWRKTPNNGGGKVEYHKNSSCKLFLGK
jgi:hypothetical protein